MTFTKNLKEFQSEKVRYESNFRRRHKSYQIRLIFELFPELDFSYGVIRTI